MSGVHLSEGARGAGIATVTGDGTVLDTWYPAPVLADNNGKYPIPLPGITVSEEY